MTTTDENNCPLYGIASASDPLKFLQKTYVAGRRSFLGDVRALLEDELLEAEVDRRLKQALENLDARTERLRPALALYSALSYATLAAVSRDSSAAFESAVTAFRDAAVMDCMYDFYGIDREVYDLDAAELHRVGTTSLILRCRVRQHSRFSDEKFIALKCLLPRYFKIRAITESTLNYKDRHGSLGNAAPKVFDATPHTIVMEFVEGETLADLIARRAVPPGGSQAERQRLRVLTRADLGFINDVALAICNVLRDLLKTGQTHSDLSPTNVIVTSGSSEPLQLKLIDFGHNFAISQNVGSSAAFRRAALFVAPELQDDPSIDSWRCDVYSLGLILLEMAAKQPIERETLSLELDRLWQGDTRVKEAGETHKRPWDGAPGLARILDELLDRNPLNRLTLMPQSEGAEDPYDYIQRLIRQETAVLQHYESTTGGVGFGLLYGSALVAVRKNAQLKNLQQTEELVGAMVDEAYMDYPSLARWAWLSLLCWRITLLSFAVFTAGDLGISTFQSLIDKLNALSIMPYKIGPTHFSENLPGRMVALSFGLTAVTYYMNNYSTLSMKRADWRWSGPGDKVTRLTTVGLLIPILWAMVIDPQAWPLCSGIGTLLVVLNNYVTLKMAQHAAAVGHDFSVRGETARRFVADVYSEWWLLMSYYSVTMIIIGVLLMCHIARDASVYAFIVVFINVAKMYRLNCVATAPYVRGWLSRDLLTLRRARARRGSAANQLAATS